MESIAVPVTLTLELCPEGGDIGSLERAVSAGLDETARHLWAALLTALEAAQMVPTGHLGCGGIVKANGRARRRIVTLAGEVTISRRRYRCGACGTELVPLDAALAIRTDQGARLPRRGRAARLVSPRRAAALRHRAGAP